MFLNTIVKILDFSQVFAENNFGKGDAGVKKFTLRNGLTTKCCYKHSDVFNLDTRVSTLLSRFHQIVASTLKGYYNLKFPLTTLTSTLFPFPEEIDKCFV